MDFILNKIVQKVSECKFNRTQYKVKRLIFASTIYVYSADGNFYKCSKQSSESFIEEYNKQYNLEFTILRYG